MRAISVSIGLTLVLATAGLPLDPLVPQVSANAGGTGLVISQVYGGGGNTGAPYSHDFIEIFNPTATPISLAGKSLQYASAAGTGNFGSSTTQLTELPSVTLGVGQYYLVQEAVGASAASPLPTPDLVDASPIAMSGTAGKVALVNSTTTLGCNGSSTACSPTQLALIIDLVGYGPAATFFEGAAPTGALSNTTAALRNGSGCTDTDNNGADFTVGVPAARNTASPLHTCTVAAVTLSVSDFSIAEGTASDTIGFAFTVSLSAPAPAGGVTFDIATADGTAGAPGDYTAIALAGQTILAGSSTYIFNVTVNGDNDYEPDESFFVNVSNVTGATVTDGQGVGTIVNDDDQPVDPCTLPFTPIYTIQGSGLAAAITGTVTTEGVVVGDFEGTAAASGFYLQDLTGDGNAATSDGIFVFTGSSSLVSVGQVVRVTGFARERFNQTTINGSNSNSAAVPAANIVGCGDGAVTPVDVTLPFETAVSPEVYEGMSVRFPQSLVIAEYFNYDRFGEIVLALPLAGEDRPYTPTAIDEPGAPALARAQANLLSRITLDDVQSAQNPATLRHPNGLAFSLTNSFRGGDHVANAVGVLGYEFSLYRIVPTGPADYAAVNPRTSAPHDPGGALRTAAMNTLNFFITPDYTGGALDNKCGPLQNVECRGHDANQPDEFSRQRTKLIAAIAGLDADVIGLNELENTLGVDALGDPTGLVAGLNALLGAGTYAYIDTGVIGTDAIRVGLIYRPAKVTPVGPFELLDSSDDTRFIDTKSRPALAQTFADNVTGERVTVAVNHLKSKGSDCNDLGDPDALDGQGNCNLTRRAAAEALVDWLASDPTGSDDDDFLILGDLNSYAMEDPIDAVRAGADDTAGTADDFTNLINLYQGTYAYSYTFDGQAGYLDHALSSADLTPQVTGAADWHINSDEADVLDYDTSFKPPTQDALFEPNAFRSSDHDPVVVGLDLGAGTAKLSPDACSPGQQAIMVIGSSGDDEISVGSVRGRVEVRFDGTVIGSFPVGGRIIVLGQAGDDTITIDPRLTQQALVYGGDGDDELTAGNGPSVLVGGNGDDSLGSGNGRDLLIGGAGADHAAGGRGDDILIGGQTQFDHPLPANRQALCAALAQWADTSMGYSARVAAMSISFGTVVDTEIDGLAGNNGLDWFIISTGDTTDRSGTEVATTV